MAPQQETGTRQPIPRLLSQFVDTFVDFATALPAAGPQIWASLSRNRPAVLSKSEYDGVPRLIAIGDLHGDFGKTQRALRVGGLIDAHDHWIGGRTTLVQVGDQLDRGADEMAILLLLERLEVEARATGGRVISMNGNHETMSVAGDFRYVDPGAYTDFARWKNWFELGERWKRGCKLPYETLPKVKVPPQAAARWVALQPGGPVTRRFLSRQPTLLRVGSSLFAHGGALPKHVDKEGQAGGMDGVNKAVQQWMLGDGSKQPGETRGRNSVVWSRHFGHEEAATDCELLRQTLRAAGAERLVVGHTIQPDLEVTHACNGRVYRIDVGMSAGCYDGEPAVLEVLNDREVRVHTESNATWAGWVTNTFWTPKTKSKSR